jgi:hypothetical protein
MKITPTLFLVLLIAISQVAFADFATTGYLDPNALDPSLPAWAQRVAFDLGPPQPFPSEHTNVVLTDFILNSADSLTIDSLGFAVNGIDPYITLFSGSTASIGTATFVLEHSPGGDFTFNTPVLIAGNYVLAISAWNNYGCPFGLSGCTLADGFSGLANLPFGHDTFFDIRVSGDVTPGVATPIPEPSHLMILVVGITAALARARFRRAR